MRAELFGATQWEKSLEPRIAATRTATLTSTTRHADRLLTTPEAAEKLRCSEQFLEGDRCTRRHAIPYVALGRKRLYRESDLDAYIERNLVGAEAA